MKMRAKLGFWDESGFSERPTVRRSWAPKGETPLVRSCGRWRVRSAIGCITCTPRGRKPKLYLRLSHGAVRTPEVIRSVRELRRHERGKLILLWDRLGPHKAKATKAFLKTQRHWLHTAYFPAYAPERNPVEYLWSASKKRLGNFAPDNLSQLDRRIRLQKRRCQRAPAVLKGFLRASTLFT